MTSIVLLVLFQASALLTEPQLTAANRLGTRAPTLSNGPEAHLRLRGGDDAKDGMLPLTEDDASSINVSDAEALLIETWSRSELVWRNVMELWKEARYDKAVQATSQFLVNLALGSLIPLKAQNYSVKLNIGWLLGLSPRFGARDPRFVSGREINALLQAVLDMLTNGMGGSHLATQVFLADASTSSPPLKTPMLRLPPAGSSLVYNTSAMRQLGRTSGLDQFASLWASVHLHGTVRGMKAAVPSLPSEVLAALGEASPPSATSTMEQFGLSLTAAIEARLVAAAEQDEADPTLAYAVNGDELLVTLTFRHAPTHDRRRSGSGMEPMQETLVWHGVDVSLAGVLLLSFDELVLDISAITTLLTPLICDIGVPAALAGGWLDRFVEGIGEAMGAGIVQIFTGLPALAAFATLGAAGVGLLLNVPLSAGLYIGGALLNAGGAALAGIMVPLSLWNAWGHAKSLAQYAMAQGGGAKP